MHDCRNTCSTMRIVPSVQHAAVEFDATSMQSICEFEEHVPLLATKSRTIHFHTGESNNCIVAYYLDYLTRAYSHQMILTGKKERIALSQRGYRPKPVHPKRHLEMLTRHPMQQTRQQLGQSLEYNHATPCARLLDLYIAQVQHVV